FLLRRSRNDKLNSEKGTRIRRLVRLWLLRPAATVIACEKASIFNFRQPANGVGCAQFMGGFDLGLFGSGQRHCTICSTEDHPELATRSIRRQQLHGLSQGRN